VGDEIAWRVSSEGLQLCALNAAQSSYCTAMLGINLFEGWKYHHSKKKNSTVTFSCSSARCLGVFKGGAGETRFTLCSFAVPTSLRCVRFSLTGRHGQHTVVSVLISSKDDPSRAAYEVDRWPYSLRCKSKVGRVG